MMSPRHSGRRLIGCAGNNGGNQGSLLRWIFGGLTVDLRCICLLDTYPCPALLPFLHGVKLVPITFCTERATSVATPLAQAKQQPVSQPPPDTREGPAVATSAPVDHLWDWFWASAPNSVKKYCDRLESDGFDSVRAITLLRPEDFQRYDMPFGHRPQLVHYAKETLGVK